MQLSIRTRVRATSPTLMCDAQVKNLCVYLQHNKKEARAEGKNVTSRTWQVLFCFIISKTVGLPMLVFTIFKMVNSEKT